jgi:hypothetical protein
MHAGMHGLLGQKNRILATYVSVLHLAVLAAVVVLLLCLYVRGGRAEAMVHAVLAGR